MAGQSANQAKTSLSNWKWQTQHVTSEMKSGEFISAATILVAAGPPFLQDASAPTGTENRGGRVTGGQSTGNQTTAATTEMAYPLGLIENFGVSQNRQLQRMFEIGSKRSYFIPGRTIGSLSLGRVLFFGPSIMRVLYAYWPDTAKYASKLGAGQMDDLSVKMQEQGYVPENPNSILHWPGLGRIEDANNGDTNADFWINLASELFDRPFGLLCILRDHRDQPYGSFYLEDCNLQAHQFNVNASSVLIAEGVSAQFDFLKPVQIA